MANVFPNIAPNAPKKQINYISVSNGKLNSIVQRLFQDVQDDRYSTPPKYRRNDKPPSVKEERRNALRRNALHRYRFNSPERTTTQGIPCAPKKNPRALTPLRDRTNGNPGVYPPAPKKKNKN